MVKGLLTMGGTEYNLSLMSNWIKSRWKLMNGTRVSTLLCTKKDSLSSKRALKTVWKIGVELKNFKLISYMLIWVT